jgi:hypothetical protein
MDPIVASEMNAIHPVEPGAQVCPYCHQPILPSYYFCPNCGTKLNAAPLSISPGTQAWIYILSVILPMMLFLYITKWPGLKYYRSKDPQARQIGMIAIVLLALSTVGTIWLTIIWTQDAIQATNASINADLGSY